MSSANQSWWDSMSSGVKEGCDKLVHPFGPPKPSAHVPGPEDDAVSLKTKGKAGPELHVAIAQLYEQSNKMAEAEIGVSVGAERKAGLFCRRCWATPICKTNSASRKRPSSSTSRAVQAYPRQASVHNNLGLCYARQNRLDEAVAALGRAIQLDAKNPLYRNNIAAVLVDQGRANEAFLHLRAVHGDAAAYYNLGYLLNKKGQPQAALQDFRLALQADPSMDAARRWVRVLAEDDGAGSARAESHRGGRESHYSAADIAGG